MHFHFHLVYTKHDMKDYKLTWCLLSNTLRNSDVLSMITSKVVSTCHYAPSLLVLHEWTLERRRLRKLHSYLYVRIHQQANFQLGEFDDLEPSTVL